MKYMPRNIILVAMTTVALALSACSKPEQVKKAAPPAPVLVAQVVEKRMQLQLEAIGTVEAYTTVSVRSQIDGMLTKVHFREGQDVRAGDPLFTIDPRPFIDELDQAKGELARNEAQLANARIEEARYKNLSEKDFAAREEYDRAKAAYAAALASVMSSRAAVSNATVRVEWTDIKSPIEGRTGAIIKHLGNVVKAKDDELLTINQVHPIYVTFTVPEVHLPDIRERMKSGSLVVEASVANHNELRAKGRLTFINNQVDKTTGSIQLKATFENVDGMLWPGQFVNVVLMLSEQPHAVVAPSRAVQAGQIGEFAYVLKPDQTVENRPLKVTFIRNGEAVISEGLKPGEIVVIDGHVRLTPGAKVDVKKNNQAAQQ